MRCFVIHAQDCWARKSYVKALVEKAGATIFDAIMDPLDGNNGCNQSHFAVYRLTGSDEDLLIFEDDCEIVSDDFLRPLELKDRYDVVFLGVNSFGVTGSYGTHALWMSARAKARFLSYIETRKQPFPPMDHLWNEAIQACGLHVWRPSPVTKYVRQAKFVKSLITGQIR
jgi:GR25 family glycosyltransferase involved in LPS biosynthesis